MLCSRGAGGQNHLARQHMQQNVQAFCRVHHKPIYAALLARWHAAAGVQDILSRKCSV